jgi:hypothetical protein
MKLFIALLVKPILILIAATANGLAFGIISCYLFPLFGANDRNWCGFKSAPPYFEWQFSGGFVLAVLIAIYFAYFFKKCRIK